MSVKISPSILASDFSSLGDEVVNITQAGADYIHVDVMDGHFVPNLTIGPDVVKSIRDKSSLPFDVHLMIDPVQPYIEKFVEAGADIVSVHPEANDDTEACLNKIKSLNVKAGLAILSLIHISEPTRRRGISYAVFCLKKKKKNKNTT